MARDEAYRQAERTIMGALRSGVSELNLRNLKLTEVPEAIGQLTNLIKLDLGSYDWDNKNRLTTFPKSLANLLQLQSLNLSHNQFKVLPEYFGKLTQLQSCNLSNNQLTALPESLGRLTQLQVLNLSDNQLTTLPESLGRLMQLQVLNLSHNQLTTLPESLGRLIHLQSFILSYNLLKTIPELLGKLTQLKSLDLSNNHLIELPTVITHLVQLETLYLQNNSLMGLPEEIDQLKELKLLDVSAGTPPWLRRKALSKNKNSNHIVVLPASMGQLKKLETLNAEGNELSDVPASLSQLKHLKELVLYSNPLNPELAEAYKHGLKAVKTYLRAKTEAQITLNEAKLILVGEGEVGKSCLLGALRGDPFVEGLPTTHGIEIKPVKITDPNSGKDITLNGWDFGGQRVYRPTHQLFFSAPAVYLVVWKPREGPQQGFVKEWIQLVKRREPEAKILVVATHGGPQQRQPDIDRQELWDLFGKETVVDFFFVDSKPDKNEKRKGIEELKLAIARITAELPEVGRPVPKSFQEVREALKAKNVPYLSLEEVLAICREQKMDDEIAGLFMTISHRLGHLTHYENDPSLRDIVILRPDWLATAMSYVLDDKETRKAHGLVRFTHLSQLWNDLSRPAESRYPDKLHRIFLRLMERFDLSYRVAGLSPNEEANPVSLIAQLVPDTTPEEKDLEKVWLAEISSGDIQQTQICHIVDAQNGQSANAEGLFYQLIVRLHKYSLGRENYYDSVHWQRGIVLDADYNGRALLRYIGNDVHITVRAPYPEFFLAMLTREVKYLVESFWEGLRCDVMVPCIEPCGKSAPGTGLFDVEKLIDSKRKGRPEFPCHVCNEWQNIDHLLRNAPAAQPLAAEIIFAGFSQVKRGLAIIYNKMREQETETRGMFSTLDANDQKLLSRIDDSFAGLMRAFTDEAKEGPRLFSLVPVAHDSLDLRNWITTRFRLTLWCEHSHLPLTVLNQDNKIGVYEFDLTRQWVKEAAPFLKAFTITLRTLLPVAFSTAKLLTDAAIYQSIENELDFSKECIDALISGSEEMSQLFVEDAIAQNPEDLQRSRPNSSQGAKLREFHALLQKVDPNGKYGNLVRVMNKRQEFLWVHEKFASEY